MTNIKEWLKTYDIWDDDKDEEPLVDYTIGELKAITEDAWKVSAEECMAILEKLKQDTNKPSYQNSIRLQAYNEVLEQAISEIKKKVKP